MTQRPHRGRRLLPRLGTAVLAFAAGSAFAHTGHDHSGVLQGLAHPMGIDHLLAMVAVGVWSARVLPQGRRAAGPAAFVLAMLAGALAGSAGWTPAGLEWGIAASVTVFGLMLAAGRRLPAALGLGLVAIGAALHGVAHGAELAGGASFAGYAAGFITTTIALQAAGLVLGLAAGRLRRHGLAWAGALIGAAGVLLMAQA